MTYLMTMWRRNFPGVGLAAVGPGFLKRLRHTGLLAFPSKFDVSQDFVISNPLLIIATFNFEGRRREGEQMTILTIVDSLQGDL